MLRMFFSRECLFVDFTPFLESLLADGLLKAWGRHFRRGLPEIGHFARFIEPEELCDRQAQGVEHHLGEFGAKKPGRFLRARREVHRDDEAMQAGLLDDSSRRRKRRIRSPSSSIGSKEGEQKRPFGSKIGHGRVLPKQADSTKKRRQSCDSGVLVWASRFSTAPFFYT